MSSQKSLKKRLKALMQRPENQVCSDCPEKKPTWASLIVPPPGAPPGTGKIGAFCCLECSGSHRRLGVHISFVRSVNLDSWKEDEVRAMENGGNAKVNAIFEARLAQSGVTKPSNLASGPTRERFIRDKYERRKFFDPAAYSQAGSSAMAVQESSSTAGASTSRGTPSDVARQRVASRQARLRTSNSNAPSPAPAQPRPAAPVPAPAPVVMDLLDFGAASPAPARSVASTAPVHDPFAASPAPSTVSTPIPPLQAPNQVQSGPATQVPQPLAPSTAPQPKTPGQEFLSPAPAPTEPKPAASNESIMALFNTPPPTTSFSGMAGMNSPNMMQMGAGNTSGMIPQQQMMNNNMMNNNMMNAGAMSQQQRMMMQNMMMNQQRQMVGGMNPQMMGMNGNQNQNMQHMMGGSNPAQMNMMMQGNPQMMNGMMSNGNGNLQSMMQGMQQMNMGNTQQVAQAASPSGGNGGFGNPMGGNAPTTKQDPFSSLGGVNAFR